MRVFKWLKRDRNGRRSSDSQTLGIRDADDSSLAPESYSSVDSISKTDDPIRTDEYKRALAEFFARRSLGAHTPPTSVIAEKGKNTNEFPKKHRATPKRRSLPDGRRTNYPELISQGPPQINFLFRNSIYLPNSADSNNDSATRRRKKHREISVSPDLLPCRNNGKERQVDFVLTEDAQSSPPPEFYRDNSLPYEDRNSYMANTTNRSRLTGDRSLEDLLENNEEVVASDEAADSAETSMNSIARKLEKMCRASVRGRFRGVPLVRRSDLKTLSGGEIEPPDESKAEDNTAGFECANWRGAYVNVKQAVANEIDLLTTIRHPHILLMMGLCYDTDQRVHSIFEETSISLYDLLHSQGPMLPLPASVCYLNDISKAASYLQTHRYVHTAISSHSILITSKDIAKLCGFEFSSKISTAGSGTSSSSSSSLRTVKSKPLRKKNPSTEPDYVNIFDLSSEDLLSSDQEPARSHPDNANQECLPQESSYRKTNINYRFQAPELFDEVDGLVYPSRRSDVYSICIILWECCNNAVPWSTLSYLQLCDLYLLWQTGIRLPQDGRYPQTVYDILSGGLALNILDRMTIEVLCEKLEIAKKYLEDLDEEMILRKNLENRFKTLQDETVNHEKSNSSSKKSLSRNRTISSEKSKSDASADNVIEHASVVMNDIKKYHVPDVESDDKQSGNESSTIDTFNQISFGSNVTPCPNNSSKDVTTYSNSLINTSSAQNTTMNKTDSTEYHGLLTPDVTRYTSRLNNLDSSDLISKLSFGEESATDSLTKTKEKVSRLNASLTPQSYKSLHIKSPAAEDMESIRTLTRTFSKRINDRKKSKYSFDIQNSSLPNTPIARSTKIRKNAWLSGAGEDDDDLRYNETRAKFNVSRVDFDQSGFENVSQGIDLSDHSKDASKRGDETADLTLDVFDEKIEKKCANVGNKRNITFCGNLSMLSSDKEATPKSWGVSLHSSRGNQGSKNQTNLNKFRSRSQSWSSKPSEPSESRNDEVTGVNIKPLVAIHERWIQEARQKYGRSHSLPNTYRGSPHAIKPASHRVDSVLNAKCSMPSQSFIPGKKKVLSPQLGKHKSPKKQQLLLETPSSAVRLAATRNQILNAKPPDFFENSLWKKEKDKCMSFIKNEGNPQCSSTPYRPKTNNQYSLPTNVDQSTNTETFQELCDRIIDQFRNSDVTMKPEDTYNSLSVSVLPSEALKNSTFIKERSSKNARASDPIIDELTEVFQRIEKSNSMRKSQQQVIEEKNKINSVSIGDLKPKESEISAAKRTADDSQKPSSNKFRTFDQEKNFFLSSYNKNNDNINDDFARLTCKDFQALDSEEDCTSLPDNVNQNMHADDVMHKSLKRCQAFSALQDARSTEDMYIDDELSAHVDMHALSDNMQLIPLYGSLHEALCDKEEDCCLIKIQEEARCDRVFIICDNINQSNTQNTRNAGRESFSSDDDEDMHAKEFKNRNYSNLKMETLPSVNLIDLCPPNNGLDVIEEQSSEEESGKDSPCDESALTSIRSIQDLIHLYEGETLRNSTIDNKFNTFKKISDKATADDPPKDEISIFILDDGEDFDYHTEQPIGNNRNTILNSSVIDDVIHV